MAAPGPNPVALPAPTPIPLTRTPQGWIAFSTIFKAKLGSPLRTTLLSAINDADCSGLKSLPPVDEKQSALYQHISDRLIVALENEQDSDLFSL